MRYTVGATGSGVGLIGVLLEIRHLVHMVAEPFSTCATPSACIKIYVFELDDPTFLAVNVCMVLLVTSIIAFAYFTRAMLRQVRHAWLTRTETFRQANAKDGGQ